MGKPQYENNNLAQLKTNILKEFSTRDRARGIIFTRTRLSAIALCQWIQENPKFDEVGVSASYLIGGGDQSLVKPMTAVRHSQTQELMCLFLHSFKWLFQVALVA